MRNEVSGDADADLIVTLMRRDPGLTVDGARGLITQFRDEAAALPPMMPAHIDFAKELLTGELLFLLGPTHGRS